MLPESRRRLLGLPPCGDDEGGGEEDEREREGEAQRELASAWLWLGTRLGSEQEHLVASM